tara:strand:+ start:3873 stop:4319 length:447 start_codon:yes stop_codon:yes gene_type:complete
MEDIMSTQEKIFTQDDVKEGKKKIHPNSLANLKPRHDKEHMAMMSQKATEARIKNEQMKEQMKDVLNLVNNLSDSLMDSIPKGLTVMKLAMLKSISEDDMVEASRLASIVAEYEQPKLQRSENVNTNFDYTDLTDEELQDEIDRLSGG